MAMNNTWQHRLIVMDDKLAEYIRLQEDFIKDLEQEINSLRKQIKKYTQKTSIVRINSRIFELEMKRLEIIRHRDNQRKGLESLRLTLRRLEAILTNDN